MSAFAYTPARVSVTNQPQANVVDLGSLDFKQQPMSGFPIDEKHFDDSLEDDHDHRHCQHGQPPSSEHNSCHNSRLKHLFLPAIFALLALGGILAWNCAHSATWGVGDLARRAVSSTNGNSNTFVHNKLYLIVIIVGLFVVLVLGIMLSAWCCKGSFNNPLCCPCYLCACCGGLACLECIGCGLCSEAV